MQTPMSGFKLVDAESNKQMRVRLIPLFHGLQLLPNVPRRKRTRMMKAAERWALMVSRSAIPLRTHAKHMLSKAVATCYQRTDEKVD